jgi:heme/copper-type cytochrome/quinol oxidase subunit 4
MPLESFTDDLADRRRVALFLFYAAALLSAVAIILVEKVPSLRTILLALAVAAAGVAILFLLRFLRSNDEREQQINYRALTFAFAGTLVFSVAIGFFQRFGFHSLSWLGISPLMIILWSVGLILYSWRYR